MGADHWHTIISTNRSPRWGWSSAYYNFYKQVAPMGLVIGIS
ncbi:MAG: hypothetical protein WCD55_12510 [Bacteroidales bacterium]